MSKILRLNDSTINAIAAGEVVERPSSVVRELIDNALDAGASLVRIEITGGGIRKITVSDDGTGMTPEDSLMSLERHATSKIVSEADLWRIGTLGFRGEALASIAAVSKLTLTSREIGNDTGFRIESEGGTIVSATEIGAPEGTTVTVRELFYNTPARFKFLKSDASEAGQIGDTVAQLALTRPDVSFRLIRDNKPILHTPGNGELQSCIYAVFGAEIAEAMRPICCEMHPLHLEGFMTGPNLARGNRARQVFIVNGRVVRSKPIGTAVDEACKNYFMKGKHPVLVLSLSAPSELVDVNVHPQKSEIRFWNDKQVFSAVYRAVDAALSDRQLPEICFGDEDNRSPDSLSEQEGTVTQGRENAPLSKQLISEVKTRYGDDNFSAENINSGRTATKADAKDDRISSERTDLIWPELSKTKTGEEDNIISETKASAGPEASQAHRPTIKAKHIEKEDDAAASLQLEWTTPPARKIDRLVTAKLLGQYAGTYIVLEEERDLLLLDQHAAHERILYERLLAADNDAPLSCQMLLMPIEVQVRASERALLEEQGDEIARLGFEAEPFGPNSVVIRGVPDLPDSPDPKGLFLALIDSLMIEGTEREKREAFALKACKAAIKAHDRLTEEAMTDLILQLTPLENPYHCPHGRPIVVRITLKEIEKRFGRIV